MQVQRDLHAAQLKQELANQALAKQKKKFKALSI
jgi:hypothetical protein